MATKTKEIEWVGGKLPAKPYWANEKFWLVQFTRQKK